MTDFVKGVFGGAWSLLVGWMLPVFLVLQMGMLLVAPELSYQPVEAFLHQPLAQRQPSLIFTAVVVGIVLAAIQTPLYRLLEGYLWPQSLRKRSQERHVRLRAAWLDSAAGRGPVPDVRWRWKQRLQGRYPPTPEERPQAERLSGLERGLLWTKIRYPADERQVAPTALGNAIRRFETYGSDRYQLDSQRLFHHLSALAPPYIREAQDRARTNVDFAVCLVYSAALLTATSVAAFTFVAARTGLLLAAGAGALISVLSYWLAVVATDEWAATVRAQVDLGRQAVAEAFGLRLPEDLNEERRMWSYVNLFVSVPFAYTGSAPAWLTMYRTTPKTTEPNARLDQLIAQATASILASQTSSGEPDLRPSPVATAGGNHRVASSDYPPAAAGLRQCENDEAPQ